VFKEGQGINDSLGKTLHGLVASLFKFWVSHISSVLNSSEKLNFISTFLPAGRMV